MKILAAALLSLVSTQAPATPNFSGDWKMNPAKSDFGGLPAPSSMVRTITHAEPSLKIVETQRSDMGDQNTTRTYTTNGSPTTFTSQGAEVRTQAEWTGATLKKLRFYPWNELCRNKATGRADRQTRGAR